MQAIKLRYEAEHTFCAPAHAVAAVFHDLPSLARCTADVESFECLDAVTARWTLATQRDLGIVFQPRYCLRYSWETPRTLCWRTLPEDSATVAIDARVQFVDLSACRSRVCITEQVEFSLPVSLITAKIVKVMAHRQMLADMKEFLQRIDVIVVAQTMAEASR
ncbi:hypothetical protein DFR29_10463 [Tahibacter aquaticus]|uniref:Polyketide cyclase/dehydrase/lipid transport protein n=1 Tax=Tahibacter aquaticus TaxID=520092 RepID=A0A4R6Z218_9GAMM|nr:hypothetical protein [Tahibacter aquaticus]TDR45635.1 hypothetical protein DFR29_10463 [Tahibacter aquaticus]